MAYQRCTFYYYTELNALSAVSVHNHVFWTSQAHRHDFFEMEYIEEGEIDCILDGECVHLKKGQLVFVTPSSVHSYAGDKKAPVKTVTVHFNADIIGALSEMLMIGDCVVDCGEELIDAFNILNAENRKKDALAEIAVKNAFERVLVLFLRTTKRLNMGAPANGVSLALSYIHKHFSEDVTLEKISDNCGYSTAYTCRIFKKETGMSPMQYLNKIRLESACRLLVSTELSAIEICCECGFGSVRNFNREFKKKYGLTPLEYRKTEVKN